MKLPAFTVMSLLTPYSRHPRLPALACPFHLHPSLSVLLPGRAIPLIRSAATLALPLISVVPPFLSDLLPHLPCPFSCPLICSFHYFNLIKLIKSHLISVLFLLLYLSSLAQI